MFGHFISLASFRLPLVDEWKMCAEECLKSKKNHNSNREGQRIKMLHTKETVHVTKYLIRYHRYFAHFNMKSLLNFLNLMASFVLHSPLTLWRCTTVTELRMCSRLLCTEIYEFIVCVKVGFMHTAHFYISDPKTPNEPTWYPANIRTMRRTILYGWSVERPISTHVEAIKLQGISRKRKAQRYKPNTTNKSKYFIKTN